MTGATPVAAASLALRGAAAETLIVPERPNGPRFPNGYIPIPTTRSGTSSDVPLAARASASSDAPLAARASAGSGTLLAARASAGNGTLLAARPVTISGAPLAARRWWDPQVRVEPLRPDLLDRFVASTEPVTLPRAPEACIGWGPGLTPAADDVVVGMLVAFHAVGHADRAAALAASCAGSETVPFSRALIDHAANGRAVRPVLDVLAALAGRIPLDDAIAVLRRFGATSGRHLIDGMRRALLESAFADKTDHTQQAAGFAPGRAVVVAGVAP